MKKPDLSAVKQFLFEKGEKIGAAACLAIMVLVVGWSLYKGFSSRGTPTGKAWDDEITQRAQQLESRIAQSDIDQDKLPPPPDVTKIAWSPVRTNFPWAPIFFLPDKGFSKKLNPRVLSVLPPDEEKHFQLDYVRDLIHVYEIEPTSKKVWSVGGAAGGAAAPKVGFAPANAMMKGMQGGGGAATNLALGVKPVRMVVVSAIFPMREQLEEFRKALRYPTINELLAKRDSLPNPIALEVSRCEVLPGGKVTPWTPLFKYDPKSGKTIISSGTIKEMMRKMVVDEQNPQELASYVFPGLVTPLPKLAHGTYPKLDLQDMEPKAAAVAAADAAGPSAMAPPGAFSFGLGKTKSPMGDQTDPAGAQGGAAELQLVLKPWKEAPKDLQERFQENYYVFDPLGQQPPSADKKTATMGPPGAIAPPMGPMGMPYPGMNMGAGGTTGAGFHNPWDRILGGAGGAPGMVGPMSGEDSESPQPTLPMATNQPVELKDALVRFFDPDVQPGKTYRYSIRVRMANPNFGKKNDVAYTALADQKELEWAAGPPKSWPVQGWMLTPEISIPGDFFWYATDQTPEPKIRGGADYNNNPPRPDMAPIQVHRWVERGAEASAELGTWAIAERFWVRRGDPVGRRNVMSEVPQWYRNKQAFELANMPPRGKKQAPSSVLTSGLAIDLITEPPALIVDYEGGNRTNVRIGSAFITESSAMDMLVLNPEGKLVVRNSREDSDPELPPGRERSERVDQWRERLQELRVAPRPAFGGAYPGAYPGMQGQPDQ